MPEREDRELLERAAREHVEQARTRCPRPAARRTAADHLGVDAGRHDLRADPVHREHPQREEDAPLQLGNAADVLDAAGHSRISTAPPAASILLFARARSRRARARSGAPGRSPSPSSLTRQRLPSDAGRARRAPRDRPWRRPRSAARSPTFTTACGTRWMFVKPRFGHAPRRSASGRPRSSGASRGRASACPGPCVPRPDVFWRPVPGPRPTRLRFWRAPGRGESRSSIAYSSTRTRWATGRDHAAHRRRVLELRPS